MVSSTGCLGLELFVGSFLQGTKPSSGTEVDALSADGVRSGGSELSPLRESTNGTHLSKIQEMVD